MKMLIISLAGIGDTLFATPLIHELRANFPDALIDAFVRWPGSGDLLDGNPYLSATHQKDLGAAPKGEVLEFLWGLRDHCYDVSFNTYPQSRRHYRLVARVIGAKTRVSHEYDHANWLDRRLVNRTLPQDCARHCIENNLALLAALDVKTKLPRHDYEMFLSAAEKSWAADYVAKQNLTGRRLLAVHVGSGTTKNLSLRRWPLDHYIALLSRLNCERPDIPVLLMGGPEERTAHEEILRRLNSPLLLQPETRNFRQAGALLKHCHAFLSVDTSLMHVAAAVGVPRQIVIETPSFNKTVEPFGRDFIRVTNPSVAGRNLDFYRYDGEGIKGSREQLLQCMASVSPADVWRALSEALS